MDGTPCESTITLDNDGVIACDKCRTVRPHRFVRLKPVYTHDGQFSFSECRYQCMMCGTERRWGNTMDIPRR
jgi:hypothetical protein